MLLSIFKTDKPLIGMIHLPPMPGYPKHPGMQTVIDKALRDLRTLQDTGFDGALVENDTDQPHYIGVPKEVKDGFAEVMRALLSESRIPVGMEIIYDMPSTLSVGAEVGADFVRFDVFSDSVLTEWGRINAQGKELMQQYARIVGKKPAVLVDVQVKHARLVTDRPLIDSAKDTISLGADGIIVTGDLTGHAPSLQDCKTLTKNFPDTPVLIGSGFSTINTKDLWPYCNGAIVGSSIKKGVCIDPVLAKELRDATF